MNTNRTNISAISRNDLLTKHYDLIKKCTQKGFAICYEDISDFIKLCRYYYNSSDSVGIDDVSGLLLEYIWFWSVQESSIKRSEQYRKKRISKTKSPVVLEKALETIKELPFKQKGIKDFGYFPSAPEHLITGLFKALIQPKFTIYKPHEMMDPFEFNPPKSTEWTFIPYIIKQKSLYVNIKLMCSDTDISFSIKSFSEPKKHTPFIDSEYKKHPEVQKTVGLHLKSA